MEKLNLAEVQLNKKQKHFFQGKLIFVHLTNVVKRQHQLEIAHSVFSPVSVKTVFFPFENIS
jgi:hypothetical protein